jgi:hypothetical protein
MKKLSRIKAIRERCIDCVGSIRAASDCTRDKCILWPLRHGHEVKGSVASNLIPKYCKWCCNDQIEIVKICPAVGCTLHPYRWKGAGRQITPAGCHISADMLPTEGGYQYQRHPGCSPYVIGKQLIALCR